MNFRIGTSGFGYKEWKGKFYPTDLKPAEMLGFYSQHFNSTELNNTFYRMPTPEALQGWAAEVPADFIFAVKAPQRITHFLRLKNAAEPLAAFLDAASTLKNQLGPLLFQLPGNFKKDAPRLVEILNLLPRKFRVAFEFRNETWFDAEIFSLLKQHNAALCIAEAEDTVKVPCEATADWGYLRLRRLDYKEPDLKRWFTQIRAQNWKDAYVYFKHEDRALGPQFAQAFQQLIAR